MTVASQPQALLHIPRVSYILDGISRKYLVCSNSCGQNIHKAQAPTLYLLTETKSLRVLYINVLKLSTSLKHNLLPVSSWTVWHIQLQTQMFDLLAAADVKYTL